MSSQIHSITGGQRTMEARPYDPHHDPKSKQIHASRALAMTGILQTTIETNELIALFSRELSGFVEFDGIRYQLEALNIEISLGRRSKHSCSYQLLVSGEELGELNLFRRHPFRRREMETIENLVSGLLYPLRNALLYHRAVQSALIDPLTGVKNRSTMDDAIRREMELARRHERSLSVILMDIDHFKQINDRLGHLYGDQVLRAVAKQTERTIRNSDMLFRYGGEEFLILLSGTDRRGTHLLAERIRQEVENLKPIPGEDLKLTVSLGVTALEQNDDMAMLFKRADAALYLAKNRGRNRVESL